MYTQFFNESLVPMYIFDVKTLNFIAVNNSALSQYEYAREEFLSLTAAQIMQLEDSNFLRKLDAESNATHFDYGKWRHIKKNGEHFFVHIYSYGVNFNGKNGRLVMAISINGEMRKQ